MALQAKYPPCSSRMEQTGICDGSGREARGTAWFWRADDTGHRLYWERRCLENSRSRGCADREKRTKNWFRYRRFPVGNCPPGLWITLRKIKNLWKTLQKGVKSRKKRLTQRNAYYIIYNCDVRWKCLGQSPGIGILLYISKQLR